MSKEISFIIDQLRDAYKGDPWFGRSAKALLAEVNEQTAFQRLNGQHSIVELIWHMITWREFTIDRLQETSETKIHFFEEDDWRQLDHNNKTLWPQGLKKLDEIQNELISLLQKRNDDLLEKPVRERRYNFRKLLHGVIQHDIYHLGQIAYINKTASSSEA